MKIKILLIVLLLSLTACSFENDNKKETQLETFEIDNESSSKLDEDLESGNMESLEETFEEVIEWPEDEPVYLQTINGLIRIQAYNKNVGDNFPKKNLLQFDYKFDKDEVDLELIVPEDNSNEEETIKFVYNQVDDEIIDKEKLEDFKYDIDYQILKDLIKDLISKI